MLCHLQTRANEKIRAAASWLGAAYKMAPEYTPIPLEPLAEGKAE